MTELWQLYDEQGVALEGRGAPKDEVYGRGLLHGAAHVWIWRKQVAGPEVLLQKRAGGKRTWPNRFDISAAGHIDLGEDPLTAAVRETEEEIGLRVDKTSLERISTEKVYLTAENGAIENEFQWLYLLKLPSEAQFVLQRAEVASLVWKDLETFRAECSSELYVPHGAAYYAKVMAAVTAHEANHNE